MTIDKRYVFPAMLMAFNIGAAVMSFFGGDTKRGVYWLASGICIAMVAFE
jgi:hypothetical protein